MAPTVTYYDSHDAELRAALAANLAAEPPEFRYKRVLIQGIQAKPELNGQIAFAGNFEHGRYSVRLSSGVKVALKPDNLVAAETPDMAWLASATQNVDLCDVLSGTVKFAIDEEPLGWRRLREFCTREMLNPFNKWNEQAYPCYDECPYEHMLETMRLALREPMLLAHACWVQIGPSLLTRTAPVKIHSLGFACEPFNIEPLGPMPADVLGMMDPSIR